MLFLPALLALAAPAASVPPAPPATQLAPDAEARWVPFELTPHNLIRFRMTVNGHEATALLDTGVTDTIVSRAFADRIGLRSITGEQAVAIGGKVPIARADVDALALGGFTRSGGRLVVADIGAMVGDRLGPVDMLVGADVLSCCALDIDFDARRFRLLPSGRMPFRGTIAPLALGRSERVYWTEVSLGGHRLRRVLIDSGDGSQLTLSAAAWQGLGLRPAAMTSGIAYGLGGRIGFDMTIVHTLALGPLAAGETELRIEHGDGYSASIGAAGRIGSALLRRYRVLLDPRAGRMVLRPGAEAETPPVRSTSGLLLAYADGALNVLHVMRNSPAAASGWKEGARICEVDGAPARASISPEGIATWAIGTPGRTVQLTLCDGETRSLTLRRFY